MTEERQASHSKTAHLGTIRDLVIQTQSWRNKIFPIQQSYGISQENKHKQEEEAHLDSRNKTGSAEVLPWTKPYFLVGSSLKNSLVKPKISSS